jgi:hypothetical protein
VVDVAGEEARALGALGGRTRTAGGYTRAVGTLGFDADALTRVCARHRIKRLSLFGSVLKGTNRPESDIDLLVEFEPGATPGLLRLASIAEELSALLGGRRVDLRTPHDLSRHFRDEVVRTAEVQFAR